jgi:cbb3-type cytochrome oxidase maturation protein
MEVLYLLIPLALLIVSGAVGAFIWAVNSGQFDDTESPAVRILMDEDESQE